MSKRPDGTVETYCVVAGCAVVGRIGRGQRATALLINAASTWLHLTIAFNDGSRAGSVAGTLTPERYADLATALLFSPLITVAHNNGRNYVKFQDGDWPSWLTETNTVLGSTHHFHLSTDAPDLTRKAFEKLSRKKDPLVLKHLSTNTVRPARHDHASSSRQRR